jgi:hypothetical protein
MSASYSGASGVPLPPNPFTVRLAAWLSLASAPSFAVMALLTAALDGGRMARACGVEPASLEGMVPMYLLMSGFHSAPWLKLIGARWGRAERTPAS